jgi:hypothetical protein
LCSINCPQLSPNQTLKIIRLSFDYVFDIDDDTILGITVFSDKCDSCILFHHAPYLIHFAPNESAFTQHGVYDFQITAYDGNPSKIVVSLYTKKRKAFIRYLNIKVFN